MIKKIFYIIVFLLFYFLYPDKTFATISINEIAWMGNSSNANAEWIELYNSDTQDIDLSGWNISGSISITIPNGKSIVAGGFFLLERTSDASVLEITADYIYTGALTNAGGSLILKDASNVTIDEVLYSSGWPAGNNDTKETMQKSGTSWVTATPTPKASTIGNNTENNNTTTTTTTNTNNTTTSSSSTANSSSTKTPAYREMIAKIISNQTMIPLNVPNTFKAEIFGHYGEKIEKGKVIWNFGDAAIEESSSFGSVSHKYKHKGEYVVSLQYFENGKNNEKDVEGKTIVKVVESQVIISKVGDTKDPYIEIENKSSYEISLKDWKLIAGGKVFLFPTGTYIMPGRKTIYAGEITGFSFQDFRVIVLMRPGFEVEDVYPDDLSFLPDSINTFKSTNIEYDSEDNFSNNQKEKDIFIDQGINSDNVVDLRGLSNQEANAASSNINPIILLVLIIVFGLIGIFFIKRWKIQKNKDEMSHLSSDDIKIIE